LNSSQLKSASALKKRCTGPKKELLIHCASSIE
jgi:hypothetical protein